MVEYEGVCDVFAVFQTSPPQEIGEYDAFGVFGTALQEKICANLSVRAL
jgi:hypothetical protein